MLQCVLKVFLLAAAHAVAHFQFPMQQLLWHSGVGHPRHMASPKSRECDEHGFDPWDVTKLQNLISGNFILLFDAEHGTQM